MESRRPTRPVIGLTGGIASGKSTAQAAFAALGAHVIDADQVARELVEPGQPALAAIVERFGCAVLDPTGRLDRPQLRQRVFADAGERRALEAILHPRIRSRMRERADACAAGYIILAIPLLVESGRYAWIDRVAVVDLPAPLQLARVMQRDGVDRAQAAAALAAQASRESRLAAADDVLTNDGPVEALHAAVARLDQRYRLPSPRAETA